MAAAGLDQGISMTPVWSTPALNGANPREISPAPKRCYFECGRCGEAGLEGGEERVGGAVLGVERIGGLEKIWGRGCGNAGEEKGSSGRGCGGEPGWCRGPA
ncbi:MAG: hypothetical protein INF97_02200 [Roseomonas sp.]|nr:hypothetical protein [Roseomonas sp.]